MRTASAFRGTLSAPSEIATLSPSSVSVGYMARRCASAAARAVCRAVIFVTALSSAVLSAADIRPDWLLLATRTVFFVAVITPWASWLIDAINAAVLPLAVGSATGVCVAFAPTFPGVMFTSPLR